jgi:hypothetical protein
MAGTIFSAVAAPLIGGAVSSIFNSGSSKSSGSSGGGNSPNSGGSDTQQAAAAADPFASQRGQYQQMLSQLMTNPNNTMTSGETFAMNKGLDAVTAQMGARGLSGSSNQQTALIDYATGSAQQSRQQEISNLMTMSGATSGSPGTAGQVLGNQATSNQTAASTFGSSVGNAVVNTPTFQGWLNGSGSTSSGGNTSNYTGGNIDARGGYGDYSTPAADYIPQYA